MIFIFNFNVSFLILFIVLNQTLDISHHFLLPLAGGLVLAAKTVVVLHD